MPLLGNGEGHTVLILTDAESRLIRAQLEFAGVATTIRAFNAGIARGTARLTEEFAELQKARKK